MKNLTLRLLAPLMLVMTSMLAFAPASHADSWLVHDPGTCVTYSFGTQCHGKTYLRETAWCLDGPKSSYGGSYLSWRNYCIRTA